MNVQPLPPTIDSPKASPDGSVKTAATASQKIVILGAGFGGLYTAYHLEKILGNTPTAQITLISQNNYFLMTPLLFEAGSGVLEPRHAVSPIRAMFKRVRFVEAAVERVDFDQQRVFARHDPDNFHYQIDYDHVVFALGGVTNRQQIPGSDHALGFKTLGDAIFLRNRIIDLFEQADIESDPQRRRKLLTFVLIGGGLVGIELMGELTQFVENLLRSYPQIARESVRFVLIEAAPRMLPEMEEDLAAYASEVLRKRGVELLANTKVERIEPERVHLPESAPEKVIDAKTIMLVAGLGANPLLKDLPLEKAKNGRLIVESTMRNKLRPEVWAIGDCAVIPDKNGKPYPTLAQHALREAKVLARNIAAVVRHRPPAPTPKLEPFVYESLGTLASLSHHDGVGRLMSLKIHGFIAWWVWRSYYLFQMPSWERKARVIIDWTVGLFFRSDIVKLDLFGDEHPSIRRVDKTVAAPSQSTPVEQPAEGHPPAKASA